jgi:LacI family transcriptional regulator
MSQKIHRGQHGAPTIADVARQAGFSPMTVSRVINGDKNVRESTRSAILNAIAKLNYTPNLAARSLAGYAQIRIGLLYSNPSDAYLSRFLLGSLEQARLSHVQLVIEKCDGGAQEEAAAVQDLLSRGVDGIILSPPLCDSETLLDTLGQSDTLAVIVANGLPPSHISVVRMDDQEAAAVMTRHILSLGHKRIGFITGTQSHKASGERLKGYQTAMQEAGLAVSDDMIAQAQFTYRSGLVAAEQLLNLKNRPTAIFACNDDMAAATVVVAHRMHLDVPGDLTVCGFGDTDFAQSIWPELTTIHQPVAAMASAAVEMLIEKILAKRAGKEPVTQQALLDFTLQCRGSDAPPKQPDGRRI